MMSNQIWQNAPIGLMAEVTLGKMVRNEATDIECIEQPYLHAANIRDGGILSLDHSHRTMWFSPVEVQKLDLSAGDIVVAEGGAVGKSAYVETDLAGYGFQNSILRIRAKKDKALGKFIQYCLQSAFDQGEIARACSTVSIAHFPAEKANRFRIPHPSLEIQQRIADYLDRETAEIDAAVADLDKYISLLELRVKTLIKRHLSDEYPHVKMGLLAKSIIGITYSPNDVVGEGGIYVYRSGNVQKSRIDRQDMLAVDVEVPPHLKFQEGDILMCSRNGSSNLVGKNAIIERRDVGQTWGAFMTVIRSDLNRYLFWFFRSPQFDAYRGLFSTSTISQLTTGILNRIPVPLPPENTRKELVESLELAVGQIEGLISESTKLRDLLLKRRSVLITEVVTGRKKV